MIKKKYKINGMDCESCAKMIELDLEDNGYTATCNFANQTLEVEMPASEDEKKILNTITGSGYGLSEV